MRRAVVAAAFVMLMLSNVVQGQVSPGYVVWTATLPGTSAAMLTSQVFVPTPNFVYFNVMQRVSNATKDGFVPKTCYYNANTAQTMCKQGSTGATFELAPTAAGNASLASYADDAVAISTRLSATNGSSDVAFLSAAKGQIASASYPSVSFEFAIPYFLPGQILARWTNLGSTSTASTTIARLVLNGTTLSALWMQTFPHQQDTRLAPSGATDVFAYEGATFFVIQDQQQSWLYKVDAENNDPFDAIYFQLPNPCGFNTSTDSLLHFRIAPYDVLNTSQVLSAMLLWGKLTNGVPAICRVSHRYGTSNWNMSGSPTLNFPTIDKVLTLSLGAGIGVVTGSSKTDATKNLMFAFDARTGKLLWTDSRAATDAGSVPTVDQFTQQVYYQKNGQLVFVSATSGNGSATSKTGCVLPPVVTPRRIYCVNSGHTRIVAYTPITDEIIFNWTAPATIAFPPVVVPNDSGTFVVALDNGNVLQVTSTAPVPPTPPPTTPTPTTRGGAAPDSDDNKQNVIIAAVVIPIGVVLGGAVAFFVIRRRSGTRRVANPEDIEAAINADDTLYNAA